MFSSKEGKTNWKYVLIVVVLGFIVSVGILRWVVKQEIPLAELPEMRKSEKIEDETADWKTYRNEEYGYEVKYPKEWFIETEDVSDGLQQINVTRFFISEEETKPTVVIHIYNSQGFSLNQWLDFYANYTGNRVINRETVSIFAPEKDIEGIKGDHIAGDQLYKGVFLLSGDKIYNTNLIPRSYREFTDEELEIFNQILSTFRFLE